MNNPTTRAQFIDLVREHQASLRVFIRMKGVAPDWVDDMAQEAFLVAYTRLSELDAQAAFGKWVRGIARKLIANERRKEARHSRLLQDHFATTVFEERPRQQERAETAEWIEAMNACIRELPDERRRLLCARYEHDENASVLAERFGLSAAAVRQTLLRARAFLQRCIEEKVGTVNA
ncbi:MAG: sigma-70 family RNA polymerase sigma factor [Kiritimatiellae bacterium]|nr:sigma-70 family RNA polymerase sigma factor [Kiritimatiellia bacterium]